LLDRIQRIIGHPRPTLTPARGVVLLVAASVLASMLLAAAAAVPPGLPLDVKMRSKMPGPVSPAGAMPPAGERSLPRSPSR
jgi:hypothetical protein